MSDNAPVGAVVRVTTAPGHWKVTGAPTEDTRTLVALDGSGETRVEPVGKLSMP